MKRAGAILRVAFLSVKNIVVLLAAVLLAPTAGACAVCVGKPLKFAFQDSRYFFVGKVIRQQQGSVTFEVLEQFQGEPVQELTLETSSSCSFSRFEHGATYLVEATGDDEALIAYLCSHTTVLEGRSATRKLQLVKRRASWWKSAFGRVSLYRFRQFVRWRLAG